MDDYHHLANLSNEFAALIRSSEHVVYTTAMKLAISIYIPGVFEVSVYFVEHKRHRFSPVQNLPIDLNITIRVIALEQIFIFQGIAIIDDDDDNNIIENTEC